MLRFSSLKVFFCKILLCSLFLFSHSIAASTSFTFLTLADLHFDPFITCQIKKIRPCPLINALEQTPIEKWQSILIKNKEFSYYGHDSTNALLLSVFAQAHQASQRYNVQFIVILGDFLAHHFKKNYKYYASHPSQKTYRLFVHKTLSYLTLLLNQTFPTQDIYAVVGNNDSYQGNYYTAPDTLFFKETSQIWDNLIKDKKNNTLLQKEFPYAGFYQATFSSLKLLVLNTVLFSYKARGKNIAQAAEKQLDWLHQQLQEAHNNQQGVIIAMHIPMYLDIYATPTMRLFTLAEFWRPAYLTRFEEELTQFSANIKVVLSGHLHFNYLQRRRFSAGETLLAGTSAISPVYGTQPGFSIYQCHSSTCNHVEELASYTNPLP